MVTPAFTRRSGHCIFLFLLALLLTGNNFLHLVHQHQNLKALMVHRVSSLTFSEAGKPFSSFPVTVNASAGTNHGMPSTNAANSEESQSPLSTFLAERSTYPLLPPLPTTAALLRQESSSGTHRSNSNPSLDFLHKVENLMATGKELSLYAYRRYYFDCDETIPRLHSWQSNLGLRRFPPNNKISANMTLRQHRQTWLDAPLKTISELLQMAKQQPPKNDSDQHPEILLTDFGWMNANPRISKREPRSIWGLLMQESIQRHPWYNPMGWAQLVYGSNHAKTAAINKNKTYYIFLDVETLGIAQWPTYYGVGKSGSNMENCDPRYPRQNKKRHDNPCQLVRQVATKLQRQAIHNFQIIIFHSDNSCFIDVSQRKTFAGDMTTQERLDHHVVLADISTRPSVLNLGIDMGLPPMAPKPALLRQKEMEDIATCRTDLLHSVKGNDPRNHSTTRPYLFSFKGTLRPKVAPIRTALLHLPSALKHTERSGGPSNNAIILIGDPAEPHSVRLSSTPQPNQRNRQYGASASRTSPDVRNILVQSKFAAAPHGDRLFSFRFAEILSAGAIPVVYADGWVLPFTKELKGFHNWKDYMVIIPENRANETLNILGTISPEKRCKMRQKAWEFFNKYMKSTSGILGGTLDVLEFRRTEHEKGTFEPLSSPTDYTPYRECFVGGTNFFVKIDDCNKMEQPNYYVNMAAPRNFSMVISAERQSSATSS